MECTTKKFFTRSRFSRREILSIGTAGMLAAGFAPKVARAADVQTKKRSPSAGTLAQDIETALAALDKDKLVKLAMDLVNIPSPLGREEETARFLHGLFQEVGLYSSLQPFAPGRCNVLGVHEGSGGGRRLMLNGHLETGGSEQDGAFPPCRIIDNEWISGRGIWNMKGTIAAYVAAIMAVQKSGIPLAGDVLIAGGAGAWDESPVATRLKGEPYQGYGVGIKHMLAHGGVADLAVVGEPTSFKLVRQHFGITLVRIDISSELSEPRIIDDLTGDLTRFMRKPSDASAFRYDVIGYAAEIVQALNAWIPDYIRRNIVEGVPPLVSVSAIEGGQPWRPGSSDRCSIFISVGTPPQALPTAVLDEMRQVLAKVRGTYPRLSAHAELYAVNPGPFVPEGSPIVASLRAAHSDIFGRDPDEVVVQWYSDASPLVRYGIPSLNYGPSGKASAEGESVRVSDLMNCARVYIDLIVRVCGEPA
ncbi:MAG: M20/M25/M40 family metallo-hydrolase [Acidobacteria bacterium]|nr:M20/M25/M40 family metallo-hydrolase [Acidobacteriota bacterium]